MLLAAAALAGCGGDDSGPSTDSSAADAARVEQAIVALGSTQEVACESVGTFTLRGAERDVARCTFTEEENAAGEMRARGGCFFAEGDTVAEVTDEVPADVTCVVTE